MKAIRFIIAAFAVAGLVWSCSEEEEDNSIDPSTFNLTPATAATPEDATVIDLDDYADTLRFTWNDAKWDGLGWPTYDIAIDKEDGDFSAPVAVYHAADFDVKQIALAKADLKEIYNTIAAGEKIKTVNIKWVVRTAAWGRKVADTGVRTITLNMTPDPDAFVAGNDIFIAGEGAKEAGQKMVYIPNTTFSWDKAISAHYYDNAPRCKEFDYEIFTELEAGKPVYFWSGTSTGDKDWYFTFDGGSADAATNYSLSIAKEAVLTATAATSGVYRIRINTATKEVYAKSMSKPKLRSWQPKIVDTEMNYAGNGVWTLDLNVPAASKGYKFLFVGLDSDQPYGCQYPSMATPTGDLGSWNPADKAWNMVSVQGGAADGKKANGTFLVPTAAQGVKARYTLYMNDTYGTYTHCISKAE